MKILKISFLCLLFFLSYTNILAQEKIKYKADGHQKFFRLNGRGLRVLVKNVVFTQQSTIVHCDSSVYYKDVNQMDAFGHIRITDDAAKITANKLVYKGTERMALLRENVVYKKGDKSMYTDFLDYDVKNKVATYYNKGKLIDSINVLTSEKGELHTKKNVAHFWKNVVLVSPDFILETDTLFYNTQTKVATTKGKTKIIKKDSSVLHSQGGIFKTVEDLSEFKKGTVKSDEYTLSGDKLYFDNNEKYYKAIGNVVLTSINKNIIIKGKEGYYDKKKSFSKVFGNPVMERVFENDTLFIAADTMITIENEIDSIQQILAYPDVRIFKENLQGKCDSAAFLNSDSLIYMYGEPIIWSKKSQISSELIILEVGNDKIKKINLENNAFIVSEDTLKNFNQVKGRDMIGYFENNNIKNIYVDGNGESIFYILNDGDSTLMGLNKLICSNMMIYFSNNKISSVMLYNKPEGKLIPPHEIKKEDEQLQHFNWAAELRPELKDIFEKKIKEPKVNDTDKDKLDKNKTEIKKKISKDEKKLK